MAEAIYTQSLVFADSILLFEEVTVKVSEETNNQDVLTQAKGWAGQTAGADITTMTVNNAVPRTGPEIDIHKWKKARTIKEYMVHSGGHKRAFKGIVQSTETDAGVNKSTDLQFVVKGGPMKDV